MLQILESFILLVKQNGFANFFFIEFCQFFCYRILDNIACFFIRVFCHLSAVFIVLGKVLFDGLSICNRDKKSQQDRWSLRTLSSGFNLLYFVKKLDSLQNANTEQTSTHCG